MNQPELINAIDSLMPEIVRTRQPEEAMLKFAHEHNLAPSQVERMGQVFNTVKSLNCMEKSANRGDSCTLVDVPALVANYTTYNPGKVLSREDKAVHKQVNKIIKSAYANDGWDLAVEPEGMQKAASNEKEAPLPDLNDIVQAYYKESASKDAFVVQDVSEGSEWVELADRKPHYDIMHKSASSDAKAKQTDTYEIRKMQKKASEEMGQIAYETKCFLQEKCAAFREQFAGKGEKWAEAVEDVWDTYGEKSASVLKFIEGYFNAAKFAVQYPDLEKRAFVRPLVQDRHGILDTVGDMIDVMELHKEAAGYRVPPEPDDDEDKVPSVAPSNTLKWNTDKDPVTAIDAILRTGAKDADALVSGMQNPWFKVKDDITSPISNMDNLVKRMAPGTNTRQKIIDDALDKVKTQAVLQQLLLSDPIISEADPDKVQSIFSTLSRVMPGAADDVNIMGPALKEALQYDSVPVQLLKDYSSFEGQELKNKSERQKIENNEYHV